MTPEAKVKQQVKKLLARYDVWYCMPVGNMYGRAGIPDFIALYKGCFIAIETKAGKNKLTALQELNLQQIKEAGGIALVINENNLNDLEKILNDADRK